MAWAPRPCASRIAHGRGAHATFLILIVAALIRPSPPHGGFAELFVDPVQRGVDLSLAFGLHILEERKLFRIRSEISRLHAEQTKRLERLRRPRIKHGP